MVIIPNSSYQLFKKKDKPNGQRLGQRFHAHFGLEKMSDPDDRRWCDQLYNADDVEAHGLIASSIDYSS